MPKVDLRWPYNIYYFFFFCSVCGLKGENIQIPPPTLYRTDGHLLSLWPFVFWHQWQSEYPKSGCIWLNVATVHPKNFRTSFTFFNQKMSDGRWPKGQFIRNQLKFEQCVGRCSFASLHRWHWWPHHAGRVKDRRNSCFSWVSIGVIMWVTVGLDATGSSDDPAAIFYEGIGQS